MRRLLPALAIGLAIALSALAPGRADVSPDPLQSLQTALWDAMQPLEQAPGEASEVFDARRAARTALIEQIQARIKEQIQSQLPGVSHGGDWVAAMAAIASWRTRPPSGISEQAAKNEANAMAMVMYALGVKVAVRTPPTTPPAYDVSLLTGPDLAARSGAKDRLKAMFEAWPERGDKPLLEFAKYLGQNQDPNSIQQQVLQYVLMDRRVNGGPPSFSGAAAPGVAPTSAPPGGGPSFNSTQVTINYGPTTVTINGQLYALQLVQAGQEDHVGAPPATWVAELVPVRQERGPNGETMHTASGPSIPVPIASNGSATYNQGGVNLAVSTNGGDLKIVLNGQTYSGREVVLRQLAAQSMFVQSVNNRQDGIFVQGTGYDPSAWQNSTVGQWAGYNLVRRLGGASGPTFQDLLALARTGNMAEALRQLQNVQMSELVPDWMSVVYREAHPAGGGAPAVGALTEIVVRDPRSPVAEGGGFRAANGVYTYFPTGITRPAKRPPRPAPPGAGTAGGGTAGGGTAGGGTAGGGNLRLPEGATLRTDLNGQIPPDWVSSGRLAFITVGGETALMFNVKDQLGAVNPGNPTLVAGLLGTNERITAMEILPVNGRYVLAGTSTNVDNQQVVRYLDLTFMSEAIPLGDPEAYARRMLGGFNTATKETTSSGLTNYALFQRIAAPQLEQNALLIRAIAEAVPQTDQIKAIQIMNRGKEVALLTAGGTPVVLELRDGRWVRKDADRDSAAQVALSTSTGAGVRNRIPFNGVPAGSPTEAAATAELARDGFQWNDAGNRVAVTLITSSSTARLYSFQSGDRTRYGLRFVDPVNFRSAPGAPPAPIVALREIEISAAMLPSPLTATSVQIQGLPLLTGEPLTVGDSVTVVPLPTNTPASGAILVYRGNPGDNLNAPGPTAVCRGWIAKWGSPTLPPGCPP